jgi:hypothetical protein
MVSGSTVIAKKCSERRPEEVGEFSMGKDPIRGTVQAALLRKQRRVDLYVNGFVTDLFNGKLGRPGGGDCFYCQMMVRTVSGGKGDEKSLGEATNNTDHILSHIEENYFVPSLLVRACAAYPLSRYATSMVHGILNQTEPSLALRDVVEKEVRLSLQKYIRHTLGLWLTRPTEGNRG